MASSATVKAELQSLSPWMGTLIKYVESDRPDLTNRQMALLMVIHLLPGPHTVRGIAARLGVSKPVITRALNTLAALGYLRRVKDEKDRRNIFVVPTDNGTVFLGEFAGMVTGANSNDGGKHGQSAA